MLRVDSGLCNLQPVTCTPALNEVADPLARHILQRHLVPQTLRVAQLQHCLRNIPHLQIAPIQLLYLARRDLHRHRHIRETIPHQRHPRLVRRDRRHFLPLEARIHQQKLPRRRRLPRHDPVLPVMNMNVICLIADVLHCRARRPEPKLRMRHKTVLRHVEPHCHRRRIPFPNLKIDIRYRTKESELARIGNRLTFRRPLIGEPQHVPVRALLKSRRVRRQHKHRPMRPIPNQPNPCPHMNRPRQPIPALRHQHDPVMHRLLRPIDRPLQRIRVVRRTIAARPKILACQINRMRIVRPHRVHGLRGRTPAPNQRDKAEEQQSTHSSRRTQTRKTPTNIHAPDPNPPPKTKRAEARSPRSSPTLCFYSLFATPYSLLYRPRWHEIVTAHT